MWVMVLVLHVHQVSRRYMELPVFLSLVSVAVAAFATHIVARIVAHITSLYLPQVCIKKELKKSRAMLVHKVKFPQKRVHPLVVFVTMVNTKTI